MNWDAMKWRANLQPIDHGGDVSGAEPVVDVHDSHVGSAGVYHAEQRRQSAEGCAIANAGGNGDDRYADEAADDAGQCPLHSGANHDHACVGEFQFVSKETVNSGDANIVDSANVIAHQLGCNRGFFGDRDVAGSGADNRDSSLPQLLVLLAQREGAGELIIVSLAEFPAHGAHLLRGDAGREDTVPALGQTAEYLREMLGFLTGPEDDLGHAGAE